MIKFSTEQYEAITKNTQSEFVNRVIDTLKTEESELVNKLSGNKLYSFVEAAYGEAEGLHFRVELDVYEYIVIALKLGLGFLNERRFADEIEWFESEFVPSVKKIQKINILLASNETEGDESG